MNKNAIVFDKISKTFPNAKHPSVFETSLDIEEGSFVTILGTSGSGKTTLLKMVNRIFEPTLGHIYLQGQDVARIPVTHLRRKIGYVIQQIGLFPHKTVEDNIATVPKIVGWEKKKINERIDFLLDLVHLPPKDFRERFPRQLSGGQQQRVGIARAMAADPGIMLMDEPFGAIDAITRSSLQDELIRIQKRMRKTILFVTHDIDEAFKLGDKTIVMNEGKIQQFDTPLNIIMNPANEFVSRFVQAEDTLQRLSLMKAENVMIPLEKRLTGFEVRVFKEESLKSVLAILLKAAVNSVIVVDENQVPQGKISINQLKIQEEKNNDEIVTR